MKFLFPAVASLLACFVYLQTQTVNTQAREIVDLRSQVAILSAKPKFNSIEVQEKCAAQSRRQFVELGHKDGDGGQYENHFNAKLGKCFVHVTSTNVETGTIWKFANLIDAYEGKLYGNFVWHSMKDKKYWEVAPNVCTVVDVYGADATCTSNDEFDGLVKPYMEN